MKASIPQLGLCLFVAAAAALAPYPSNAQTTNKVPVQTGTNSLANPQRATKGGPFHGKLAAVDKINKTIVVGKRTFQITSGTRIKKAGKPATLEDGVVGDTVSGYVKAASDGKWVATTVNFGPKPATESGERTTPAADKEQPGK